jgi:bifunctional enzyme CysN/CysC
VSEPAIADQFEARLAWRGAHELIPGRRYRGRFHDAHATVTITAIKYRGGDPGGAHLAARTLRRGESGVVNLSTDPPVRFAPYDADPALGAFRIVDDASGETLGEGRIDFALRRGANLPWQALEVRKESRAALKGQKPACIWLTGLSGSGKSTIANALEKRLHADGRHTDLLDGDNVRHGLNRDLGFTEADRAENVRRVAEVARLMVDAGLIVIVSFISPFRAERGFARALFGDGEFVEVFVDTPLEECERRDPKGLYAKARRGALANFTGIDSPYEPPESAEVRVNTLRLTPAQSVEAILGRLG